MYLKPFSRDPCWGRMSKFLPRSTMVTAILPVMTLPLPKARRRSSHSHGPSGSPRASIGAPPPLPAPVAKRSGSSRSATSQTAGLVGMFSGLGALLALSVFLPLPTAFAELMRGSSSHDSAARATSFAFYTVGLVALLVALACFFGLRNLAGEEPKGLHNIIARNEHSRMQLSGFEAPPARFRFTVLALGNSHLAQALRLGGTDASIGLGYLGGFVARASSVAISLFIPLFVNVYFIRTGQCHNSHSGTSPGDIKRQCRRAYALAAMLSGVSQLVALLCAPLFGYLDGRVRSQARSRWWRHAPLLGAAACGVVGYVAFARLASPAPGSEAGSGLVFLVVALLGVSQIGAIVCSLSLLSRGIQGAAAAEGEVDAHLSSPGAPHERGRGGGEVERAEHEAATEESALLPHARSHHDADAIDQASSRAHLKGSIAGVYSLAGGAGILLLTKLGGQLFDGTSPGAPFYMMAAFNGVLLAVGLGAGGVEELRARRKGPAMA